VFLSVAWVDDQGRWLAAIGEAAAEAWVYAYVGEQSAWFEHSGYFV
jgi:hypothetical protein